MKKALLLFAPLLVLSICILCYITLGTSPWGLWKEFQFAKKTAHQYSLSDADVEGLLKDAVEFHSLEERGDGLYCQPNESKPYSGWTKTMYASGQARTLVPFKDGKRHGLLTNWHGNGQKRQALTYKDGIEFQLFKAWNRNGETVSPFQNGLWTTWHDNGQKSGEVTYKDGKQDGLGTEWHENGQKKSEVTWKDGEKVSVKYWNSEGEEVETYQESQK